MPRWTVQKDGRSDSEVVASFIADSKIGAEFTYAQIMKVVNQNRHQPITRERVSNVIQQVNRRILPETGHMLINVRTVGYRIASAEEQFVVVQRYVRHGERSFERGNTIAQNTRLSEITDRNERLRARELRDRTGFSLDMVRASITRETRRRAIADRYLEDLDSSVNGTIKAIEAELAEATA